MSSIDSSVRDFIAHPENHHLINEGGVIKAISGRSEVDETVHQIALQALNALSTEQGTSPRGIASFLNSVTPLSISSDASVIKRCQQAEFNYKINKWAQEAGQGPTENRAEAAIRIKNAYSSKDRELDLSNLRLTSLPPEISQLTQLQVLNLGSNHFTDLPAEICQLLQLNVLNLGVNHLTDLPAEIGQLLQLNVLNLEVNKLTDLPAEIGQLLQLKVLNLGSNHLADLPAEIGQLTQLKVLHLEYNQLSTLPRKIDQLAQLQKLLVHNNPLTRNKTICQITADNPGSLKLTAKFYIVDDVHHHNLQATLNTPQTLKKICQLNGLALEFIPHDKQTKDLVLTAIIQNPASIAFVRADLMTYELAKRAVAINPNFAQFVPNALIDIPTVLAEIEEIPYLLSLFFKKERSETLIDALTKDKAENLIKAAIAHDYKLIGLIPADIQASDFGHDLIKQALEQTPLAYYGIDPVFFNEDLFTLMIQRHKDHPDLKSVLKDIISLMNTEDTALRDKMLNLAYPLSQYFRDDKDIILMLISKYGISLQDISNDLKTDPDIVAADQTRAIITASPVQIPPDDTSRKRKRKPDA